MKTSQKGINLIKQFEGRRLTAYKPVKTEKYFTVGFGHYGADVKAGMVITAAQAEALLKKDIEPIERLLNGLGVTLKQQQFDALVSWIYNLGAANFNSSTLRKKILAKASDIEICDQIVKWTRAGGIVLLGLVKRRVAEANMWMGTDKYYNIGNTVKRR